MDSVLQAQFQRVEAALSTLVESIAAYNPSPQAALDLVAADDELSHGLDELARHQANHARILALRAEDEALTLQLKSGIATLADLRRELFETPATTFSDDSRPVPFDELLQFAKNISKHTVPPTYRERVPKDEPEADKDNANDSASSAPISSNGLGTPAIPAAPAPTEQPPQETSKHAVAAAAAAGEGETQKEVTAEQEEWLTKLRAKQQQWYPWPDDNKIRSGNLMAIQHLLDQGKRPENINIFEEAEEEKQKAEEELKKQEASLTAQEPQVATTDGAVHAVSRPPPPPQATFGGYEDFEEDDI